MTRFDRIIAIDWSARAAPSPRRCTKDAIYICQKAGSEIAHPTYHRTREAAMSAVEAVLDDALQRGERVLIGFDFAFGYPMGVARRLTGGDEALAVWDWLAERVTDDARNRNNRFEVAAEMNRRFPGIGPFWGTPGGRDRPDLPGRGSARRDWGGDWGGGWGGGAERRLTEAAPGAMSGFQIMYAGAVGSQTLLGLPRLAALRRRYGADLAVWPLETGWIPPDAAIVLIEIYPGLWRSRDLSHLIDRHPEECYHIADARQVRCVVDEIAALSPDALARAWGPPPGLPDPERVAREEGWIFGAGMGADR